jgi:hypothetical protein
MCTVSWLHQDDGYQLLCNRDEKRTRATATGPEVRVRDGVLFVSPTDQDAGGTWIGTNELGISLCLLNGAPTQRAYKSRGLLVLDLLSASSLEEVRQRVRSRDLCSFAPFTLVVLEPRRSAARIEWSGHELSEGEPCMPLVSSSFDPKGVRSKRSDEFVKRSHAAGELTPSVLIGFHVSHGAGANAYSPCMHRSDAQTVSFSWVKVTKLEIEFFYLPGAPCQAGRGATCKLPRLPQRMGIA